MQKVFSDVASKYDLMNDLMTLGMHRIWKDAVVKQMFAKDKVLIDLAGGTGDIAQRFLDSGGKKAIVYDLNPSMLKVGENRSFDTNRNIERITFKRGNVESISFPSNSFDYASIVFGIRNVTNVSAVLKEAFRVLKPGGKFVCLEFSPDFKDNTNLVLMKLYDVLSFHVLPYLGRKIVGNSEPYTYLVESIRKFLSAKDLEIELQKAGFVRSHYKYLTYGFLMLHTSWKF